MAPSLRKRRLFLSLLGLAVLSIAALAVLRTRLSPNPVSVPARDVPSANRTPELVQGNGDLGHADATKVGPLLKGPAGDIKGRIRSAFPDLNETQVGALLPFFKNLEAMRADAKAHSDTAALEQIDAQESRLVTQVRRTTN